MKRLKVKSLNPGFTLIELLVSMTIFVMFLGIISVSYINVVRANRQANSVRSMYAQMRILMENLSEDIKLSAVDYDCYEFSLDITKCPAEISFAQINPDGTSTYLVLVNKNNLEKTVYFFDAAESTLKVKKFLGTLTSSGYIWNPDAAYALSGSDSNIDSNGFRRLVDENIQISNVKFALYPAVNPYQHYVENHYQFQPKVTIFLSAENTDKNLPPFSLDLQTTVSSRVYSK